MADKRAPTTEPIDLGHIETPELRPTNDMALVSALVGVGGWGVLLLGVCSLGSPFGLLCGAIAVGGWAVAIVTGYLSLREIADGQQAGSGLARLGIGAGIVGIILVMVLLILLVLGLLGLLSLGFLDALLSP